MIPDFTAHDIVLDGGRHTMPGGPLIAEGSRCRTALRLLGEEFGEQVRRYRTVADLGCLEGGFTVEFARAGYRAVGVEVRALNMAKCLYVEAGVDLPNLDFVQADARDLPRYGPFDAVFCCGLLYHLDQPAAFLRMLGEQTRRLLIVQSHYSQICQEDNEGYRGHWALENPTEESVWSSYGNSRSFWLGRDELMRAMRDAGFTGVRPVDDGTDVPGREMFAGVRP